MKTNYEKGSDIGYEHIMCMAQSARQRNCGSGTAEITYDMVCKKVDVEAGLGTTFILPMAVIIETGNHIAQSTGNRFSVASSLVEIIHKSVDATSPWAAFTVQSDLWKEEALKQLANRWKGTVVSGQSLGDASIVDVANYYHQAGYEVEIYTGDAGLKSYEPSVRITKMKPRRRR